MKTTIAALNVAVGACKIISRINNSLRRLRRAVLAFSILGIALIPMRLATAGSLLFEGDYEGHAINSFTTSGTRSFFATASFTLGLAFNKSGDLFEVDSGTSFIWRYSPSGVRSTFTNPPDNPTALAFDANGSLFVAMGSGAAGRIYKYTPSGSATIFATGLYYPQALAFDANGNLFAANNHEDDIYEYTPTGIKSIFASGLPADPHGLAFDASGNLFATYGSPGLIYKFTPSGVGSVFASGLDGPEGLAFDTSGNLFVTDFLSGHIYEFTPDGRRSTFASGLNEPSSLAFAVPEPPVLTLLGVSGFSLIGLQWVRLAMGRARSLSV